MTALDKENRMALPKKRGGIRRVGLIAGVALIGAIAVGVFHYASEALRGIGPVFGVAGSEGKPAERIFDLRIEHGTVADDMRTLRVMRGDSVRLRWAVDAPVVLHLHGYDIERKIAPGAVTEFAFTAHAAGRFPVSVHEEGQSPGAAHDETPLVNVEVYPR
jgi:hypothetical protein